MRKSWSFSFYFLFFAGVAAHGPYRVLYYRELDFSGAQIGLLTGIGPLLAMISLPLMTGLADRTNRHRLVLNLSLLILIAVMVVFPLLEGFGVVFAISTLLVLVFAAVIPLADSAVMFMLGDNKDGYARVRLGGTVGFGLIATVTGALVDEYGLRLAFWSAGGLFFGAFLISQMLIHNAAETGDVPIERGRASELLRNPQFVLFLLLGISGGIAFNALNAYMFPYMESLGAAETTMGIALTIGTIAEVPVLFYFSRFIKRFSAYNLVLLSTGLTALRLLLLVIAPNPLFVLLTQLLNGLNYPLLMVAGVTYADEQAPAGFRATAQGLFNASMSGVGAAIGGFVGGLLFDGLGPRGMYLVFGGFILAVMVFVELMRRSLPESQPPENPFETGAEIAV